jgi:predicted amidohydrolase YtcJ
MGLRATAVLALACLAASAWAEGTADRILVGGRVLTVDARDRIAEAIAIKDGRILAVGTTAEIERLAGPGTERIDLAGRTATPGLIDAHAHFSQGGLVGSRISPSIGHQEHRELVARRRARCCCSRAVDRARLGRGQVRRAASVTADLDAVGGGHTAWLVHDRPLRRRPLGGACARGHGQNTPTRRAADRPDADGDPTGVLKPRCAGWIA